MGNDRLRARTLRLWKIEELLITRHGLTAIEIGAEFKVNRRTIYRDLQDLQELGVPLYQEAGRFRIIATYKVPSYRPALLSQGANP